MVSGTTFTAHKNVGDRYVAFYMRRPIMKMGILITVFTEARIPIGINYLLREGYYFGEQV